MCSNIIMSSFSQNIPILFVEGGIGCGKSTLVKKIQEHCSEKKLKIITIQEPVDIWVNIKDDKTGKNMIEAFYEDQEKYSFEFQMMAYISRLQRLQETMADGINGGCDLVICERSLQTDKNVFCKMLYDEGKITSYGYQIYNKWFDYFQNYMNNAKFVYLKTDYNKCFERVSKRNRNGESEISKDYLMHNNKYHDDWLLNEKKHEVLVLDGNIDEEDDNNVFSKHIDTIFSRFIYHDERDASNCKLYEKNTYQYNTC